MVLNVAINIVFMVIKLKDLGQLHLLIVNIIILASMLPLFILLVVKLYQAFNIWLIFSEKILSLFFIIQMVGYALSIFYFSLGYRESSFLKIKCFSGVTSLCMTLLVEICPSILVIIYTSVATSPRSESSGTLSYQSMGMTPQSSNSNNPPI